VQISQHGLLDGIKRVLEETGFPADFLELEITESALMAHEGRASHLLEELRGLGVRFAIDDFGTGYSSLSYLKKYPIKRLKVDKIFIDEIVTDVDDLALVSGILSLANSLSLSTVIEGVETQAQLATLKKLGSPMIQGYLFSRPIKEEQMLELLRNNV
jgi:EAL domain-containing protein (putative c-di-GMP-specific phosphodiesterase class I)